MNIIYKNNVTYRYESYWRKSKNDDTRDSEGKRFPWPKEGSKYWTDKIQFVEKLIKTEDYLLNKHKFKKGVYNNRDCLICGKKNITTGSFNLNNIIWEDGLNHYIEVHDVKPSPEFVEAIFKFNPDSKYFKRTIRYGSHLYTIENMQYLKLDRNQILILDALLEHGGYSRKYIDTKRNNIYRYSEHSGLLDFNHFGLDRIIISGKTNRVDQGDEEIFLPKNMSDALDYEYLFHTHPPTPKPGGRANIGILYEFPSISDLFHFIDHFNDGQTQGSIVVASEGLYIIRKLIFDREKIKINEDHLYRDMMNAMRNAQQKAIKKYGTDFTTYEFYSKISQDRQYIDSLNDVLEKYELKIEYYPRERDESGKWFIDTIYLPVFVIENE